MSETKRLAIPTTSIRPSTIYTTNSIARDKANSSSRPLSTYSTASTPPTISSRHHSSVQDNSRPSTIYISSNVTQSFKLVRRQRQRRPSRRGTQNVLNQTLDNFYNTLRRTKTYQTVKSANNWVNEYESYRKSVILEEKEYENYRLSMILSSKENEYENDENTNDFEPPRANVRHRRNDENNSSAASSVSPKTTKTSSSSSATTKQSRLSTTTTTLSEKENQMIIRYQNSLDNRQKYKATEPLYSYF